MSETWKRWEGQVVNGALPLLRYLGGAQQSAVFLTERVGGAPQRAAIKIIPAATDGAEEQLLRWKQSANLAHPSLIRLFESGRCELEGTPFLYVVMECAEEDLSQILPDRPLTPAEAQEMLVPVLKALAHIHSGGLVHGHVKPSNIMASGDQVKVSSDTLRAVEETAGRKGKLTVYDPPEASSGKLSPAADVWALGVTLAEVLTQRLPVWNRTQGATPALPEGIPEPFLEIARRCLQVDPQQRWTVPKIAARLQPAQPIPAQPAIPKSAIPRDKKKPAPWHYVLALTAVLVVALMLMPGNKTRTSSRPAQPVEVQPQEAGPASSALPEPSRAPREPKPSPATRAQTPSTQGSSEKLSQGAVAKGAVLQQMLPRVSPSARDTIEGKIRVRVRVEVDPSGNVTEATLVSPGPSKYFARLAREAARGWKFTPAQVRGQAVASEWILRFGFRRTDTEVVPEQTAP
ncbi:MAG: TonB family protein [Terriglobales bacterium]